MNLVIDLENLSVTWLDIRGSHWYIVDEGGNIQFSVIWAFSQYKFYWLIINQHTNTQYEFYLFLMKLINYWRNQANNNDNKYWTIYDSASIKNKTIKKLVSKKIVKILTILPYWSVLNVAEKLF